MHVWVAFTKCFSRSCVIRARANVAGSGGILVVQPGFMSHIFSGPITRQVAPQRPVRVPGRAPSRHHDITSLCQAKRLHRHPPGLPAQRVPRSAAVALRDVVVVDAAPSTPELASVAPGTLRSLSRRTMESPEATGQSSSKPLAPAPSLRRCRGRVCVRDGPGAGGTRMKNGEGEYRSEASPDGSNKAPRFHDTAEREDDALKHPRSRTSHHHAISVLVRIACGRPCAGGFWLHASGTSTSSVLLKRQV